MSVPLEARKRGDSAGSSRPKEAQVDTVELQLQLLLAVVQPMQECLHPRPVGSDLGHAQAQTKRLGRNPTPTSTARLKLPQHGIICLAGCGSASKRSAHAAGSIPRPTAAKFPSGPACFLHAPNKEVPEERSSPF